MSLNCSVPLSTPSNLRGSLVGRRVGRFAASLQKMLRDEISLLHGSKAPARPAGGHGPCQGPRRGGVQGAAPLAHRFTSIHNFLALVDSQFPRFGRTFILAMISSDLSDFSEFLRRLLLE